MLKSRQFATLSLLLVVYLDVALETYPIANTRTAITKEEYKTSLYNDGTKEAAADIQSKDLGLYRITKSYTSVFLMMLRYNNTMEPLPILLYHPHPHLNTCFTIIFQLHEMLITPKLVNTFLFHMIITISTPYLE